MIMNGYEKKRDVWEEREREMLKSHVESVDKILPTGTAMTTKQNMKTDRSGDSSPEQLGGGQSLFPFNDYATIFA